MSQDAAAYYSRRIDQTRAAAAIATCNAARQAHEIIATNYAKRLAILGKLPVAA